MGTPWDAQTYDRTSAPQQAWASDVLTRLEGLDTGASILDVGCGTGRVTERLVELVPDGRVLAIDASAQMTELASQRLGERAEVRCLDALELDLGGEVDVIAPELEGFSPWTFAGPEETGRRLAASGFEQISCWLEDRPTSILAAHLDRLEPERREPFARAVLERLELPLDYVRLNISARRAES